MSLLQNIITRLFLNLRKNQAANPPPAKTKPQDLPPDVLAKIMDEAEFLKQNHSVDVRSLVAGEQPESPKPATK